MTKENKDIIDYMVLCVGTLSKRHELTNRQAYLYMYQYGGINFLLEYYDVEHTQSIEDAVEDCTIICQRHGGALAS